MTLKKLCDAGSQVRKRTGEWNKGTLWLGIIPTSIYKERAPRGRSSSLSSGASPGQCGKI